MTRQDVVNHLLALVLALVLWFYVQSVQVPPVNAVLPVQRFSLVTLETRNRPADLDLGSDIARTVSLTVRAPEEVLSGLAARDLIAYIDLAGLSAGTNHLAVRVDVPAGLEVLGVTPARVEVVLEPITANSLPVTLVLRGVPAEGYFAAPGLVDPPTVTAVGPQSAVMRVAVPVIEIDVTNRSQDITHRPELQPLDSAGRVVPRVVLNPAQVQYLQPIYPVQTRLLRAIAVGQLAPGVRNVHLEIVDPEVRIAASPETLTRVQELLLEVNVEGIVNEQVLTIEIRVPPGVFLVSAPRVRVRATAVVGS